MLRGEIREVNFEPVRGSEASKRRTVAIERVGRRVGQLPAPLMLELEDVLRLHLGL